MRTEYSAKWHELAACDAGRLADEVIALRASNARLREALQTALNALNNCPFLGYGERRREHGEALGQGRAALGQPPHPTPATRDE